MSTYFRILQENGVVTFEWKKNMRPFALTLQNGKKKYSLEFKLKALELSNERGSLIILPNELNVSSDNIKRW